MQRKRTPVIVYQGRRAVLTPPAHGQAGEFALRFLEHDELDRLRNIVSDEEYNAGTRYRIEWEATGLRPLHGGLEGRSREGRHAFGVQGLSEAQCDALQAFLRAADTMTAHERAEVDRVVLFDHASRSMMLLRNGLERLAKWYGSR